MLKRKLLACMFTFLLSLSFITILLPANLWFSEMEMQSDFIGDLFMYSVYIGLGLLLYGLPVSILIEKIANKLPEGRMAFTFGLHILFGFLPFFLLWFFTLFSLISSILFFVIDEGIRFIEKRKTMEVKV
ncbi:hypothetical protein ABER68_18030 [Paenibacillus alvei]